MRLSDLFAGDNSISDAGKAQQSMVHGALKGDVSNHRNQVLTPGQTIQGEIVSKNGSEVQIRLSDDMVLQARVDQNVNLEVGKMMTFEVKSNGHTVTLGPLFMNMATDANVLKALDMASLPINQTTVSMTKQLMEAGMPIDRNMLQQIYREVNLFPQAQSSDIVNLHKLQMPVNEGNVTQMASYRNLTHQLVTGLNNVLDAVPDMFTHLIQNKDTEGAAKLYTELLKLVQEMPTGGNADALNTFPQSSGMENLGNIVTDENSLHQGNLPANGETTMTSSDKIYVETAIKESLSILETMQETSGSSENGQLTGAQMTADEQMISPEMQQNQNVTEENIVSDSLIPNGVQGEQTQDVLKLIQSLFDGIRKEPEEQKPFLKPLLDLLGKQWTITPEEVADKERVETLYRTLDKQIKNLTKVFENVGQTESTAYKAVTNLSQNLDFLQQVNQAYTYVQLPLRLQQGKAHGDLYVYSNKKHLAMKDGQISALLHLDMEHLGPVDVYVAMAGEKVNTQFYVCDDEMLDFLMGHMDILTGRLQKRGYQCSFEMQVRKQEDGVGGGIESLLQQEKAVPLAEYSFDVRT